MIFSLFIVGLVISLASLIGVLFVSFLKEEQLSKVLPSFISFSAGTFLFTTGFMLLESFHTLGNYFYVAGLALLGYAIAFLLSKAAKIHYHHNEEDCGGHPSSGRTVLIGDALHNIADGFILVPAFMISPILGIGTALSIFIHEALQEISEFFVLKHAGYSTKKALILNFLVSLSIFIGIGIGLLVLNTQSIQGVLLALASGFFMFVLFQDLLPHQHGSIKARDGLWHILLMIIGIALLFAVQNIFAHSHEHGDSEDEHHIHIEHQEEHSDEHPHHEEDEHGEDEHHDEH